jgi:inosine-uridine nucleoside N-ribohydrolase
MRSKLKGLRSGSLVLSFIAGGFAMGAPTQVIIDTDPGTDDAIAIMLALHSPEIDVRALTVVAGNVPTTQGVDNALRLLALAKRCGVPVAAGAKAPLVGLSTTDEMWHGDNGLGNLHLAAGSCKLDARSAPDLIIEMVHRSPHAITLVAIGPLTNLALALIKDPSIADVVKQVVVMGGSLSGGNMTAAAEFNIYSDPEAAAVVFDAAWPVKMIGLDVCNKTLLTRKKLEDLAHERGPAGQFVYSVANYLLTKAEAAGGAGTEMYDPLAVGVAIDPTLVNTEAMRVDVETIGRHTRGETVGNRWGYVDHRELRSFPEGSRYVVTGEERVKPNVQVGMTVEADRFIDLLVSRIKGH